MRELESALRAAGKTPQNVYGVSILAESAKSANLDWSGDQLNYLNVMGQQVQEALEGAAGAADPDKWKQFWEKNKKWIIPSGGLLLVSIALIAGRPYLMAGRDAIAAITDKDD